MCLDSSKTDLTGKSLSRDQLLEKSKKSPSQKRKDKKDDRRGRGLHSVKKQRQVSQAFETLNKKTFFCIRINEVVNARHISGAIEILLNVQK